MFKTLQIQYIPRNVPGSPLLEVTHLAIPWIPIEKIRILLLPHRICIHLNKRKAWAAADRILRTHLWDAHGSIHLMKHTLRMINISKTGDPAEMYPTYDQQHDPLLTYKHVHETYYIKQNEKKGLKIPLQYATDFAETIYSFLGPSQTTLALCNQEHVQQHKKANI